MARTLVFAADLNAIIARTEPRAGIRWCQPADHHHLAAAGLRHRWLDPRTSNGAEIIVAGEDGRIAGYLVCLTTDRTEQFDWLTLVMRQGCDILSFGFVSPEQRGQGLYASMKGFAARHFAEQGYRRDLSVVDYGNLASIRAHERVGAVVAAQLTRFRIGGAVFVWHDRELRHVAWRRNDAYVLSL